jgi:PAS domain S-box-containing protein
VPFAAYPTPLFDASGDLIGAVNMLIDITDRKRADEVKRLLSSIVQFSDDAIISKNLEGIIKSWNAGAERIFGYTAGEAIGQSVKILIPPDRLNEETEIISRIRRGERIEHYETVRRRKDGSLIDISLTVSPIMTTDGRVIGASKIARDITERKRSQAHISVLAHEAEHRAKNVLATAQAVVNLTEAETVADFKIAIEGRLQALATSTLYSLSRAGRVPNCMTLSAKNSPPTAKGTARASLLKAPRLSLNQARRRRWLWSSTSWLPMQSSTVLCPCARAELAFLGPVQKLDASLFAGPKLMGRP